MYLHDLFKDENELLARFKPKIASGDATKLKSVVLMYAYGHERRDPCIADRWVGGYDRDGRIHVEGPRRRSVLEASLAGPGKTVFIYEFGTAEREYDFSIDEILEGLYEDAERG